MVNSLHLQDRSRGIGETARRRNGLVVLLSIMLLVSAVAAAYEYTVIQSLNGQIQLESSLAEVVYNLPGVAIPVPCCPRLSGGIVVGQYLLNSSDIFPMPPFAIDGTDYRGGNGAMLLFDVAPLAQPRSMQNATFIWRGTFNESDPFPVNSSIFSGHADFHWYVLDGLLYVHIETK